MVATGPLSFFVDDFLDCPTPTAYLRKNRRVTLDLNATKRPGIAEKVSGLISIQLFPLPRKVGPFPRHRGSAPQKRVEPRTTGNENHPPINRFLMLLIAC